MANPIEIFKNQTGDIALIEIPVGDDPVTVRVDGLETDDALVVLRKTVAGHTQPAEHEYPAGWDVWMPGAGPVQFNRNTNEIVVFGKGDKALYGKGVTGNISAEYQV